jgi:methylmalonyl-CoA mutase
MVDTPADDLALAAEFPPATRQQWRQLVDAVLKGAPFEEKLVGRSHDGLRIEPLYEREKRERPLTGRRPGTPWTVLQRVDHPDPTAANAEALHDLENGANGLVLVCAGSIGARGFGLVPSPDAIARALESIQLDAGISIELDLGAPSRTINEMALTLAALAKSRGIAPATADIRFGLDPLGAMALSGGVEQPWSKLAAGAAGVAGKLAADGFKGPFLVADGRVVHDAGGSEAQELAYVLAAALAYLRALETGGVALDRACRMIFFRLAADADQFPTIAKFRALRRLWARFEDACGVAPVAPFVAAETAWRMMTRRDPHVNLLRTTVAAFAAGVGGADAATVLPFTLALGLPDRFARRIARNTQLVLLEEAHLAKVADPTAGAGGFEDLTDQLCRAAWTQFQAIEAEGGAAAALERGSIQKQVAAARAERQAALARGQETLVGTTVFANPDEVPVRVLEVAPQKLAKATATGLLEALTPMRLAEPFEAPVNDKPLAAT